MMDGAVMPFPSQFAGLDLTWFDKSSMLRLKRKRCCAVTLLMAA
jgi:hypothetical protein